MNYLECRNYLKNAEKYGSVLGLENMRTLMSRFQDPQDGLRVIHVAGTNGKGSVIAYLYTTLQLTGRKIGRYISPTLYSYRERLEINGEQITEGEFARIVSRIALESDLMAEEGLPHPTPFEMETAAAFLYFAEHDCDLVLLEVGMGGDLDATNIIKKPVMSVIASISMDHMAFLGNTLGDIADKKAGIIKPGCPMVTVRQKPEAEESIRCACERNQVPLRIADPDKARILRSDVESQTFVYEGEAYTIHLAGTHLKEFAVLALEALQLLHATGIRTTPEQRKKGLFETVWNGRFTILRRDPLFIVDGAHNPAAADTLAASIETYFPGKKLFFIIGMFRDKDYESVLKKTCHYAERIWTIQTPDNARALPAAELAQAASRYHQDVTPAGSIEEAVNAACRAAGADDVILAFGSLSFIGILTEIVRRMPDLSVFRADIDRIDEKIVQLFEERMKLSEQVADYKIRTGKQVLDPEREASKIHTLRQKAHSPFNELGIQELFRQIMAISRKRQYQLLEEHGAGQKEPYTFTAEPDLTDAAVVFQGVEGAYSHAAMRRYFGQDIRAFHVKTFREAMDAVVEGKADYAVLPIENSTAGIVTDIYDLLTEKPLYMIGEQILPIEHVLLGTEESDLAVIRTVCSHPQALQQCKSFLEQHPEWEIREAVNTAEAARTVREMGDPSRAAIASREAGELYGLRVLKENICPNAENVTRFIILGSRPEYREGAGRVSICFELPHEKGSLYNLLSHIIYNGLNMTRIESRPVPGRTWEYRFFVDFEGNLKESAVRNTLRGLEAEALRLKILGNY